MRANSLRMSWLLALAGSFVSGVSVASAQNAPAFEWRSVLNMYADESGFVALEELDLVFAPPAPVNAHVVVKDAAGGQIAQWGIYPDHVSSQAVFARLRPDNAAEGSFTPGQYQFEFMVGGQLATRVPFEVKNASTSDDPFNPGTTLMFDGPWQDLGFFVFDETRDGAQHAEFRFWAGRSDLGGVNGRTGLRVEIKRGGTVVGHSRTGVPFLSNENMDEKRAPLLEPHEGSDPNAERLTRSALNADGNYTVTVSREADGGVIREFSYRAQGGKIVPLARTALGYSPHADYIPPRTLKTGTTTFEFTEAVWVSGDN